MKPLNVKSLSRLTDIDSVQWNALVGDDYPFIRHEFLSALEETGAVAGPTGWQPAHLVVMDGKTLLALMPLYLKAHSRGEYVFDQTWAQAYHSHGLSYYPKYLTAIPFTPCQGPRLLVKTGFDSTPIIERLINFIGKLMQDQRVSSWHCLFPDQFLQNTLQNRGCIIREDVQFQWFNRNYRSLDDFLQTLTASKRKMIKRERRKISEQGIRLHRIEGSAITDADWQMFYRFYASTYLKRHAMPYLNLAFFQQLAATIPETMHLVVAIKAAIPVAAALFFVGADTLYGRYWGCEEDYDALHFETCYYQGIEYCIEQGLLRFDSGAQGEHKIARGFEPVTSYSAHWIQDRQFSQAIADFVARERLHVDRYKAGAADYLPFKKNLI